MAERGDCADDELGNKAERMAKSRPRAAALRGPQGVDHDVG